MWQETSEGLYREFEFADFRQAFSFMGNVAEQAEAANHHPKWINEYNQVRIWLFTHSERAITDKDRSLAIVIDNIYEATQAM